MVSIWMLCVHISTMSVCVACDGPTLALVCISCVVTSIHDVSLLVLSMYVEHAPPLHDPLL